jgi:hypothetical protein
MNNSYLDIQYLNKISIVKLVCPKFIYFVFTPHGNNIIICYKKSANGLGNIIMIPKLVFEISSGIDEGIIYLCTNVFISHIVS